jgi:hypothetical protein
VAAAADAREIEAYSQRAQTPTIYFYFSNKKSMQLSARLPLLLVLPVLGGAQLTIDLAGLVQGNGHSKGIEKLNMLGAIAELMASTMTDDCPKFQCPAGQQPVQSPHYVPVGNGCGTDLIKLESKFRDFFRECCDGHDMCYMTCGSSHKGCEDSFKSCLEESCYAHQEGAELQHCLAESKLYSAGTSGFGCSFFTNAQRDACVCDHVSAQTDL